MTPCPRLSCGLLTAILLFLCAPAEGQKITRGPYLQWVTQSTVQVVWDQDKATVSEVQYGLVTPYTGKVQSTAAATHHELTLTGLVPNSSYSYSVYSGGIKLSSDHSFPSAVQAGTPFRFVVVGDTRSDKAAHTSVVNAVAKESNVRLYLNTGDLVSDGTVATYWDEFFQVEAALLAALPFFPMVGNHDEDSGKAPLYLKAFVLPNASPDPEEYYSFDYGNAHFVVLDSHINVEEWYKCALKLKLYDGCFTDDQLKWLNKDLAAAKASAAIDHVFVLIHMGPYSSKAGRTGYPQMRELLPTFKSNKVSFIFSGHDHYYERGASDNGLPYIITGGGGAPLYALAAPSPLFPHKVLYNKSAYHYVVVDVNGKSVKVTTKTPAGLVLDTATYGAPPPPPPDAGPDSGKDGGPPDVAAQPDAPGKDQAAPGKDQAVPGKDQAVPGKDGKPAQLDGVPASGDTKGPTGPTEAGCSCRMAAADRPCSGALPLLVLLLVLVRRRRQA